MPRSQLLPLITITFTLFKPDTRRIDNVFTPLINDGGKVVYKSNNCASPPPSHLQSGSFGAKFLSFSQQVMATATNSHFSLDWQCVRLSFSLTTSSSVWSRPHHIVASTPFHANSHSSSELFSFHQLPIRKGVISYCLPKPVIFDQGVLLKKSNPTSYVFEKCNSWLF